MTETYLLNETPEETWATLAPGLNLSQLDQLDRDNVNIQCLNSSDFIIGKQTNFNGPVTIISCAEVLKKKDIDGKRKEEIEKKVVFRDKVLSRSAAMKLQKLGTEGPAGGGRQKPKNNSKGHKLKKIFRVFGIVFVGLFLAVSVVLAVIPATSVEESLPQCTLLSNNHCIFSGFDWRGRQISGLLKALQTPVPHVIISQTYEDFCYEIAACLNAVKWLQLNSTDKTACNFYVGGDGNSYEDLGWRWQSSLKGPAAGDSLQICLMGNHSEEDYPTYPQMATTRALIQLGIDNKWVSKDYIVAASNATSLQDNLGSIYRIIKKWPNFSSSFTSIRSKPLEN